MANQNEEGIPYTDHSGDEQHQNNQQNQQQVDLDLNATANGSQESAGRNAETGGTQNGQPNSGGDNSGGRQSTSAFDRIGPGDLGPRPFGRIGSDDTQIIQDLRHRVNALRLANAPRLANVPHLGGDVTQVARMTENPLRTNLENRSESNTVVTREREGEKGLHLSTDIPRSQTGSSKFNSQRVL
ncbi:hypothetical protein PIB30_004701 [Stylosanthes scabra]|uniref:Uncharacterized protein n=1 Tax=Stylosanthes scabra TaxID=79078 RepID=A0ABU6R2N6_9FABA|nr:hypothetical protein [Stylosanthes scabra]